MGNLGFQELIIILLIVLVLFGAKRIPEVGQSLGRGIREFKKATREITSDLDIDDEARGERKSSAKSPAESPGSERSTADSSAPDKNDPGA